MNLAQIEQNVAQLDTSKGFDLVYDLLRAYGIPKASITRLQKGTHDRSKEDNEHLWKGKLYYRFVDDGRDLHALIDDAKNEPRVMRERPRFLIVRDDKRLLAIDTKVETTLDIDLVELPANAAFFLPWAGIEKTQLESLNYADIKAAEKMARLYDEIVKHNDFNRADEVHDLNVFFSRLLFCFFAEDTGVFSKGIFTNAIASLTEASGRDTGAFLTELFRVLNIPAAGRAVLPEHFQPFGYVNGKLFEQKRRVPEFSAKARRIILECGTLNWSQINPDIFGSMIQAVVHPSQREGLGMHYTSVENIMKVIRPLFLDELETAFEEAVDNVRRLERLLERIARIKVFDPACGSGNFLVISYKELRKMEHRILQRLGDLQVADTSKAYLFKESKVKLENFFGIEIDDFAHEIAILSLWLAKHQMNVEFKELFGVEISLIPLRDTGNVICGNAARMEWSEVCPASPDSEVFVLGNPPYRGASLLSDENREDLKQAFGSGDISRNLDYVSAWFVKGSRYVQQVGCGLAFVATNSICQGSHTGALWPFVLQGNVSISFAHTSFRWANSARRNAGVSVVIIGLAPGVRRAKLYSGASVREVGRIGPYLTPAERDVIVEESRVSLSGLPPMDYGSKPTDGGHLIMTSRERQDLLNECPEAERFVRRFTGTSEFLYGKDRFCIWIEDSEVETALQLDRIAERVERVSKFRGTSKKVATAKLADKGWRFQERRHQDASAIIIPIHTSEHREYIPIGFLGSGTVVSNAANVVYGAELWLFALLHSRMHMVWVQAIAGRIKSDFRYSATLCYNTFPVPGLTSATRESLTRHAFSILGEREQLSQKTPAELYDPQEMPEGLRAAHLRLDQTVDGVFRTREFESDEDRLQTLLEMYMPMEESRKELGLRA